jgi:GGDEF domain-containing protein
MLFGGTLAVAAILAGLLDEFRLWLLAVAVALVYAVQVAIVYNAVLRRGFTRLQAELAMRLAQADESAAFSRAYFLRRLDQECHRSRRYQLPLGLILTRCAASSDNADKLAAEVILSAARTLRREDIVGRLADREYGFCIPHTAADGAEVVISRLAEALAPYAPSFGLAVFGRDGDDAAVLIESARRDAKLRLTKARASESWNVDKVA